MKNIKNLKLKSQEGLEVKNLQRFPSMEWGDEGGIQADIYFNNKFIARVYNKGNGGCAMAYMQTKNETEWSEFKQACFDFLMRNDKNFGPNSPYEWLRNKTPNTLNSDDLESVVNAFEERYDDIKFCNKQFKKGYHSIAILKSDYQTSYLSHNQIMTDKYVDGYLKAKDLTKKFNEFKIIKYDDNLQMI